MSVQMEVVPFGGWSKCIRLANKEIELVATTEVGPRLIKFSFIGGKNLFKEFPDVGKTGGDNWKNYGGHRLWHAPEIRPRSYIPDNGSIEHQWDGKTVKLMPPVEGPTGIQKQIDVTLSPESNAVTVRHQLTNKGAWPVELAPWALTVMQGPGRAILPQEPSGTELLPTRPLALWGYTNMCDARWKWGAKYIQLTCDPAAATPQKIGAGNKQGWAAYLKDGQIFIKRYPFDATAKYPDYGCNTEFYTRGDMLEAESLGPLAMLAPGATVEHTEFWSLFKGDVGTDEEELDKALAPLLRQTIQHQAF